LIHFISFQLIRVYGSVVFSGVFDFATGVASREEVHGPVLGAHRLETIRLAVAVLIAVEAEHLVASVQHIKLSLIMNVIQAGMEVEGGRGR